MILDPYEVGEDGRLTDEGLDDLRNASEHTHNGDPVMHISTALVQSLVDEIKQARSQ